VWAVEVARAAEVAQAVEVVQAVELVEVRPASIQRHMIRIRSSHREARLPAREVRRLTRARASRK